MKIRKVNAISFIKKNWYKMIISYIIAFTIIFLNYEQGGVLCGHQPPFVACFASNLITSPLFFTTNAFLVLFNAVSLTINPHDYNSRQGYIGGIGTYVYELMLLTFFFAAIYFLLFKLPTFFQKK